MIHRIGHGAASFLRNRRVDGSRPEQKNRLAEQLRAERGGLDRTAEPLDERHEQADRAPLLGFSRASRVRSEERRRHLRLGDERGVADEHRRLGCTAPGDDRAVPEEAVEIEEARREALEPETHGQSADVHGEGDRGDLHASLRQRHRAEDDRDPVHLPGQRIARQHALAMPAVQAAGESDQDADAPPTQKREFPEDAAARETEPGTAANRTAAAEEDRRIPCGDQPHVVDMTDGECVCQRALVQPWAVPARDWAQGCAPSSRRLRLASLLSIG